MLLLQLPGDSAESLAPHRTRPGWEWCAGEGALWLRISGDVESLQAAASLPALGRYQVDSRRRLVPLTGTLPIGREPAGPWLPLSELLPVLPPPALFPGRIDSGYKVELVRSSQVAEPGGLFTSLHALLAWAETASRARLRPLVFAASVEEKVFVGGAPLPPVPGQSFYFQERLALPCGWGFASPLRAGWVAQALAIPASSIALIHPPATVMEISQESFVPLTLAALRRTRDALNKHKQAPAS